MATPRRKACVECRQQKIRCDVEQHKISHDPCGRCKKMELKCRILPTSTRSLRQTKAEMRRELEELRWNLRQNSGDPNQSQSTAASPNIDTHNYTSQEHVSGTYSESASRTEGSDSVSLSYESRPPTRKGSVNYATLPRYLEGYLLDAKKIDDCFALFFTQYHPLFPILDPLLGPNYYYDLSPFLFWTIMVTGSRRYSEDALVLQKTSQHITPLAFSSVALRSSPIPVIQGLLILCIWRLPTNSMYKDMTHLMCGSAVYLATQIGLHISGEGQDFARMPLKKDQDLKIARAKLWLCCVIVSIRTSCAEGIPPLAESFFDSDEWEREDLMLHLPADLQYLHKVFIILLHAMIAMGKANLQSIDCDVRVLRSLISIFDSQLLKLAVSSPSPLDSLQLSCARVHIMAFHFFAHPTSPGPDMDSFSRLYSLCVGVIEAATAMVITDQTSLPAVSQSFIDRTIALAGFTILRLVRSTLAPHLDLVVGEKAFLRAVQFLQSVSLQQGDIGLRTAMIMTDLWNSNRVFCRRDGRVEPLALRLRTRLSMSVSYDMFWYWREEFGNMQNPYNSEEASLPSSEDVQTNTPHEVTNSAYAPQQLQEMRDSTMPVHIPVTKLDNTFVNSQLQNPALTTFDRWNGPGDNTPPTIEQFPDYDWAAGFEFSNSNLPGTPVGPMNPAIQQGNIPNIGYNFG